MLKTIKKKFKKHTTRFVFYFAIILATNFAFHIEPTLASVENLYKINSDLLHQETSEEPTPKISILTKVKGVLILAVPMGASTLTGDLNTVYLGNNTRLREESKIKVIGTNDGTTINLKGIKRLGNGYTFTTDTPSIINEYTTTKSGFLGNVYGGPIIVNFQNKIQDFSIGTTAVEGFRLRNSASITIDIFQYIPDEGEITGKMVLKFSK